MRSQTGSVWDEPDKGLEPPVEVRRALKAWAAGAAGPEQQKMAYNFVVEVIASVDRPTFAMPDEPAVMAWRQGRRFVGLRIRTIVNEDIKEEALPLPPARTMVERAKRRAKTPPRG